MIIDNLKYLESVCNKYQAKLVVVTKKRSLQEVQMVLDFGVTDIAENRLQDAVERFEGLGHVPTCRDGSLREVEGYGLRNVSKHFIGPIQTNKIRDIVAHFDVIHSVSSVKIYEKICKEALQQQKQIDILFQLNMAKEPQKSGFTPQEFADFVIHLESNLDYVSYLGLMVMGPHTDDQNAIRSVFKQAKRISDKYRSVIGTEISMGMSDDYQIALEEGSTMIRVGSGVFIN